MTPEYKLLIPYIRSCCERGEIATYEGMSNACGVDIRKKRHILSAVLGRIQREYGFITECVPSVGYRRVGMVDVADRVTLKRTGRIRSQTRRFREELNDAGVSGVRGMVAYNKLAFIEMAIDQKTQKTIEAKTLEQHKTLNQQEIISSAIEWVKATGFG